MDLLTQNGKMKKSSQNGITNVNWTIPAFMSQSGIKTCPNAGLCAVGCYARQGAYQFGPVKLIHEAKLALTGDNETKLKFVSLCDNLLETAKATQIEKIKELREYIKSQIDKDFVGMMIADIEKWLKKRNVGHLKVRIHDAGDFYSISYLNKWIKIMSHFEAYDDRVSFYAYTKQVEMFQNEKARLPSNFRAIFSFGGKQDHLIQIETDFHARVFETVAQLEAAGYQNGTDDDMVAALGSCLKVGLCYHGTKNFENTKWDKVA